LQAAKIGILNACQHNADNCQTHIALIAKTPLLNAKANDLTRRAHFQAIFMRWNFDLFQK
jgi:hypothetical protein